MDDVLVRQQVMKDIVGSGDQLCALHRVGDRKGKGSMNVWLAITSQKLRKDKVKILKIKGTAGHFRLSDSWRLEDLKKIDGLDSTDPSFALQLEKKPYFWAAESILKKDEFLATLIEVFTQLLLPLPGLSRFILNLFFWLALSKASQQAPPN